MLAEPAGQLGKRSDANHWTLVAPVATLAVLPRWTLPVEAPGNAGRQEWAVLPTRSTEIQANV